MLLCRQCILESPSVCLWIFSLEEKLLTHAAACYSLLGFGYVTKPKIESSFTAEQGKRFKFINSNNKGQHYTGFSREGVGERWIMPASSGSDLTLAGAGTRRQASTVVSWAYFPSWPLSLPPSNYVTSFRTWESNWATREMSLKLSDWEQCSEPSSFSFSS